MSCCYVFRRFCRQLLRLRGEVRPGTNEDELLVIDDLGGVTVNTSPLRRAKPAVRHLRSVLSQHDCPVESIAIFAEADCRLHPTAPDGVLALSDLHYFLRTRLINFRATHARYLDAARLDTHIDRTCGHSGEVSRAIDPRAVLTHRLRKRR